MDDVYNPSFGRHGRKKHYFSFTDTVPKNNTFLEHINSDENPRLHSMSKNNYRVVQLPMQMYNFKMNIRLTKIWGYLQPDGHWQGAVALINR